MKTRSIIIIIIFLLLLVACTTPYLHTAEVFVLKDVTEKEIAKPDLAEILSLYQFTGSQKWNGGEFQFSTVSDVSINKTIVVKIERQNKWLSNELARDRQIRQFLKRISEIIQENETDTTSKDNSSVYLAIAKTLNALSDSKSERRILLVYSDLMENTPEISFYQTSQLEMLSTNPEVMQKHFESLLVIRSLAGIEVHLIYQPKDLQADQKFQVVSSFYKKFLESKGATVVMEANIQTI